MSFLVFFTPINLVKAQESTSTPFVPTPARPSDLRERNEEEGTEGDQQLELGMEDESQSGLTEVNPEIGQEESGGLLSNDLILYSVNLFPNKEAREDLIDYIEEHELLQDQFVLEKLDDNDDFLLYVNYSEEATSHDVPILLYTDFNLSSSEEAEKILENNLLIYPDLFFSGEVVKTSNTSYDLVFGIRNNVDAQALWYDEEKPVIYYESPRNEFTIEIDEDREELYRNAIGNAFPNQFEFTSSSLEDGLIKFTMNQRDLEVDDQSLNEGSETQTSSSIQPSRFSRINTWFNRQMNRWDMSEKLADLNITESNITIVTYAMVGVIFLIGLFIIVIGRR